MLHDVLATAQQPSQKTALVRIGSGRAGVQPRKATVMVSCVSDVSRATTAAAWKKDTYAYCFIRTMPDLNRSTHRLLGQSGAGWTFETICRLVHHVGRVGKPQAKQAAKDLGRLGVGLQAIADEAGISVAKVRRDLIKLVDLGLVAVSRRNVQFQADPATGRIKENRTGRSLPVIVFLTVGPEHCRTKPGQDQPASTPAKLEGGGAPDRDHSGGAIQRDRNTERKPDGLADRVGRPQASQEAGLEAGQASATLESCGTLNGRENATQSLQEVRVHPPHDDLPLPVGRISRPASSPPRQTAGRKSFPEDRREPQAFTGRDAELFQATMKRLQAEQAARDAEDRALRESRTREAASDHPAIVQR